MNKQNFKDTGKCCLCKKEYTHYGNNALPLKDGRCCDECNAIKVIPERLKSAGIILSEKDTKKLFKFEKRAREKIWKQNIKQN